MSNQIVIHNRVYNVCPILSAEEAMFAMFDKKHSDDEPTDVYSSGIKDVYCSENTYQTISGGGSGCCSGPQFFVIDNRTPSEPRLITTNIRSISYGYDTTGITIDGKSLTSANSLKLNNSCHFVQCIRALINN